MALLDQSQIKNLIPHREPFLFLSRVTEFTETTLTAELDLTADMVFFAGHYPGQPIMPGVLLCEATFQAAAVLLAKTVENPGGVPVLSRIKEAKFKRMLQPGDTVQIKVEKLEVVHGFHFLKGSIFKEGKLCMSLECALAMMKA